MPLLPPLLRQIKPLRDAIVHASPVTVTPDEAMSAKEFALFEMQRDVIDNVVDNAVELTKTIERIVRGNDDFIGWLKPREQGRFPEAVFS